MEEINPEKGEKTTATKIRNEKRLGGSIQLH